MGNKEDRRLSYFIYSIVAEGEGLLQSLGLGPCCWWILWGHSAAAFWGGKRLLESSAS